MVEIGGYAAPSEYDPPSYAQVTKVTGAQTILFIAGQAAYNDNGGAARGRDFAAQARAVFRSLQAHIEAGRGTLAKHREDRHLPHRHPLPRGAGPDPRGVLREPAATQVAVSAVGRPEWLIEVEAIAVP
jgi:enamine deaminase RidA (YjgF/YER057c/UK114 family)